MKKVVLTVVISCVLIVALLLAFAKFIVNAPQPNNAETSSHSQTTGVISIPSTTIPSVSTAPPDTSAPPKPESQPPVVPETSPKETEGTPPSSVPQTSSPAQDSNSTEKEELPSWKKQYANYVTIIQNYYEPYDRFALVYIDDDDIPELYMYRKDSATIRAIRGNGMIGLDLNSVGGGNYHEKSGHFMNVYQDGKYLVMRIYHLTNAFYEVFCGMEDKTTDPPTYYSGDSAYAAVSEETYKYLVSQYIDTDKVTFLHENALTYDEFMELMKN